MCLQRGGEEKEEAAGTSPMGVKIAAGRWMESLRGRTEEDHGIKGKLR